MSYEEWKATAVEAEVREEVQEMAAGRVSHVLRHADGGEICVMAGGGYGVMLPREQFYSPDLEAARNCLWEKHSRTEIHPEEDDASGGIGLNPGMA